METNLPSKFSDLIKRIESVNAMNSPLLHQMVEESGIGKDDIWEFANFGHPKEQSYGRHLVHDGGKYKVFAMSWNPGDFTSIHSHGLVDWGIVKYFGEGHQSIFNISDDNFLREQVHETVTDGTIAYVTGDLIHQTGNAGKEPIMTLHIYGSERATGNFMEGSRVYNLEKNSVSISTGAAYFNLPNEFIIGEDTCPYVEREAFINNGLLLLQYYQRFGDTTNNEQVQVLIREMVQHSFDNDITHVEKNEK